ncbi:MAG: hypothetical protein CMP05_01360 [Xanthomarina sp.]|uniref:hypothetical protein n=1 Tax=Xanthomarina sp. TaxID=1931211 RepID=UPI000C5D48AC|nr:hypothetical protein [Xanthomarina sp.]MAL23184.1 hypothetical protein [Xanthomarina sp.]MBF60629.1 hypothetical protein [Xanthomarina sp.]HAB27872.1 hypothetical protein [Xanthomarina gelatinilytica]|tara:strand:- start:436 stop:1755 length:1320 start_codon:yes stop_codon:yes gene_type:complete
MIKKLVFVFIALFAIKSYAQEGTASPYSFYGMGSLKFKGTVESRSMGGLSVYSDSIHINLRNPASYASKNLAIYNNESRPVKFAIGGSHTNAKLKSDTASDEVNSSTLDYLAMSFPIGRFGLGMGLIPYTSVGYKLETLNNNNDLSTKFRGEGGVNKVYASLGYLVMDGLSVGVDLGYNFGNVKNNTIEYVYTNEGSLAQYQTREDNRSDIGGLSANFGIIFSKMIQDKFELTTSLTFRPEMNLNSENSRTYNTITINAINDQEYVINSIEADLASQGLKSTDLVLPTKLSLGAGIGQPRIWFVGAEYTYLNTKAFKNELYASSDSAGNVTYSNASTVSIGGFVIPDYNSFSSYFKRVVYRAGVRFEGTGLNINDQAINEFGISFGVGLPMGNTFSNANLGVEFGKRGTTSENLIQENFINFQLSFSFNDRWFQKRRFN